MSVYDDNIVGTKPYTIIHDGDYGAAYSSITGRKIAEGDVYDLSAAIAALVSRYAEIPYFEDFELPAMPDTLDAALALQVSG